MARIWRKRKRFAQAQESAQSVADAFRGVGGILAKQDSNLQPDRYEASVWGALADRKKENDSDADR